MSTLARLLIGAGGGVPTEPGTRWGGGFFAGRIMVDGVEYALVVAPKSQGGEAILQWKTGRTTTSGTTSTNDGWANTQAMIQAGSAAHPAAAFCRGLNINGYDDWYMPARDELEILYRSFKPTNDPNNFGSGVNPSAVPPTVMYGDSNVTQTNVDVFKEGGEEAFTAEIYWSSTHQSVQSCQHQNFTSGAQGSGYKNASRLLRAVRRVALTVPPEEEEEEEGPSPGSVSYGPGTHTFIVPPETTEITVTLSAGGGGGGSAGPNAYNGSPGGSSSLQSSGATLVSVSGGGGGTAGSNNTNTNGAPGQGGTSHGTGGYGGGGGANGVGRGVISSTGSSATGFGDGGGGAGGGGSPGSGHFGTAGSRATSIGGGTGGQGAYVGGATWGYSGGGGGGRGGSVSNRKIEVTPGQEITVSVGRGGSGGHSGQANMPGGGAGGGSGSCTISWD